MGTGILATLLHQEVGENVVGAVVSSLLLTLGWVLLVCLTSAFVVRCVHGREHVGASLRDPAQSPAWGTVSMGLVALGTATATVLPHLSSGLTGFAVSVDAALWVVGTALGIYTALDFGLGLLARDLGDPTPVWGLPVVAPMASATAGAALVDRLPASAGAAVLVGLMGCFAVSFVLAGVIFSVAYHHHWRRSALPLAMRPSLWICLGVVGQSTAAAQVIAQRFPLLGGPGSADVARALADVYGIVTLLGFGIPLGCYAVIMTLSGFLRRMPFGLGWWAMTFPVGACALGAALLAESLGSAAFATAATSLVCLLVVTWTLCASASLRAVLSLAVRRPR